MQSQARTGRRLAPIIASLAAVLGGTGCDSARYTEAFLPEGDITHVVIQSDSGAVELVAGPVLRVERTIRAPEGALHLSHQVQLSNDNGADGAQGETLVLEARCTTLIPCAVDIRVEVPPGVSVAVSLGTGDVWASGLGDLSAQISRGSLDAEVSGPLSAQIGVGTVQASLAAHAAASVAVGRGDIEVLVTPGPWALSTTAASLTVSQDVSVVDTDTDTDTDTAGRLELIAPAGQVSVLTEPSQS